MIPGIETLTGWEAVPEIDVIVTRHDGMVKYLAAQNIEAPVKAHVDAEDIRGKNVLGNLPLHLAAEAATITTVPLDLPPEKRGEELSEEEVRKYADRPQTYVVVGTKRRKQILQQVADNAPGASDSDYLSGAQDGITKALEVIQNILKGE